MSIPPPIPRQTIYVTKQGSVGLGVWALQRALNSAGFNLVEDGNFGPRTDVAVKTYQSSYGLVQDGVAGGATQKQMVQAFCEFADPSKKLPKKLAKTQILGESGGWLAAVNWNVEGGVDCGATQRRVYSSHWTPPWPDYGAQFYSADVERAFDSLYQVKLLVKRLRERHDAFFKAPAVSTHERAWRLAVLAHNYPAGADRLSRTKEADLSSYWKTPQRWVVDIHAHFPDGHAVQTPLHWCQHYSTGNPSHNEPGFMVKGVVF